MVIYFKYKHSTCQKDYLYKGWDYLYKECYVCLESEIYQIISLQSSI